MAKYRKKPVTIEAFRLGVDPYLPDWFMDKVTTCDITTHGGINWGDPILSCDIKTLEGVMVAQQGDYIIRGIKGEIYPCKPDIFEATYELVEK